MIDCATPIPHNNGNGRTRPFLLSGSVAVLHLGRLAYPAALRLMEQLAEARRRDEVGDLLLLVEHPPVITLGQGGGYEDVVTAPKDLQRLGIQVVQTGRGGRATYHGPGQLVVYPILRLPRGSLHDYVHRLEETVIRLLAEYGLEAERLQDYPGVWLGPEKIAAIGVAVQGGVTMHGLALNVDPPLDHFEAIVPCGLQDKGVTSIRRVLKRPVSLERIMADFIRAFRQIFGVSLSRGLQHAPWLVAPAPQGRMVETIDLWLDDARLHTVCEEAACPNLGECWAQGTATFMILGDICTRHCRFCAVTVGRPRPPDPAEPERLAQTASRMGLRHVVVTSVARDDLPDGGAAHFVAVIEALHRHCPGATVELLVPDFDGSLSALQQVLSSRPDVFNHNMETVPRLYPLVQPRKSYRRALAVLTQARRAGLVTKSGLMLGLGETRGEVLAVMRDLRRAGCDILTLGQYLQPTPRHLPVAEYIHPAEFAWYKEMGRTMGFRAVAAGPLVRSSYHAAEVSEMARESTMSRRQTYAG
jgi:lipoic acid synthetase